MEQKSPLIDWLEENRFLSPAKERAPSPLDEIAKVSRVLSTGLGSVSNVARLFLYLQERDSMRDREKGVKALCCLEDIVEQIGKSRRTEILFLNSPSGGRVVWSLGELVEHRARDANGTVPLIAVEQDRYRNRPDFSTMRHSVQLYTDLYFERRENPSFPQSKIVTGLPDSHSPQCILSIYFGKENLLDTLAKLPAKESRSLQEQILTHIFDEQEELSAFMSSYPTSTYQRYAGKFRQSFTHFNDLLPQESRIGRMKLYWESRTLARHMKCDEHVCFTDTAMRNLALRGSVDEYRAGTLGIIHGDLARQLLVSRDYNRAIALVGLRDIDLSDRMGLLSSNGVHTMYYTLTREISHILSGYRRCTESEHWLLDGHMNDLREILQNPVIRDSYPATRDLLLQMSEKTIKRSIPSIEETTMAVPPLL